MKIYIIDDKKSRQKDYGWNQERFSNNYPDIIVPVWNTEVLNQIQEEIFEGENVVLFHESFPQSNDFQNKLKSNSSNLYITYFSGSKSSRVVEERVCMLPPEILYLNLELFVKKSQDGNINFKYLAFGEKSSLEKRLQENLKNINKINTTQPEIQTDKKIFFASTQMVDQLIVYSPFTGTESPSDWELELYSKEITDNDLDELVHRWFDNVKYDLIYIPLCFGKTLSDFLGLRLAMHIRFTETKNASTPIFIYGEVELKELLNNYCFEALKLPDTTLIGCSNKSFEDSINQNLDHHIYEINLRIPSNIGDNHSVSNKWAIQRWKDMILWDKDVPEILNDNEFLTSLYFKYLTSKFGKHDRFRNDKYKYKLLEIPDIEGKKIVYIDDEIHKGWGEILKYIIEEKSNASLHSFTDFSPTLNREDLVDRIKLFIDENDADCYIIDLRLHATDFENGSKLTGHEIAEYIRSKNKGNQIVVFTASNQILNLKHNLFAKTLSRELKIGAIDYILKESPELNLNREGSKGILKDFKKAIEQACRMSYLKDLYNKQKVLTSKKSSACKVDNMINLLSLDKGTKSQVLLKAALLEEVVFVENFITSELGYFSESEGKKPSEKVYLFNEENYREQITGHIFFKKENDSKHSPIVDVSEYYEIEQNPMAGWEAVKKSDITSVSAYLLMVLKLQVSDVRKYINFKKIRNTQVAHGGGNTTIKAEEIVDFYYSVICPLIENSIRDPKHSD